MSVSSPHILVLDEPTNHLDVESINALSRGLDEFEGGVVLVSHDARLVRTLHASKGSKGKDACSKGQLVLVEGGKAEVFEGGMEAYTEKVQTTTAFDAFTIFRCCNVGMMLCDNHAIRASLSDFGSVCILDAETLALSTKTVTKNTDLCLTIYNAMFPPSGFVGDGRCGEKGLGGGSQGQAQDDGGGRDETLDASGVLITLFALIIGLINLKTMKTIQSQHEITPVCERKRKSRVYITNVFPR